MLQDDLGELAGIAVPASIPGLEPFQVQVVLEANAAVIVAHPDDETLWAGGQILTHPEHSWFIASLCRRYDLDRSRKFFRVLQSYGALGAIADLDDSLEQLPLSEEEVQHTILELLPASPYDFIFTHAPGGEYTRHRRHEEVSQAVIALWQSGAIQARELRLFAYEDDHGQRLPKAIQIAHQYQALPLDVQLEKYRLVTEVYGFSPESWEARAMPRSEAFWCFRAPSALQAWLEKIGGVP